MKYLDQIEDGSIPLHLGHSVFFFGMQWREFPETTELDWSHAIQTQPKSTKSLPLCQSIEFALFGGIILCVSLRHARLLIFRLTVWNGKMRKFPRYERADDPNFGDSHTAGCFDTRVLEVLVPRPEHWVQCGTLKWTLLGHIDLSFMNTSSCDNWKRNWAWPKMFGHWRGHDNNQHSRWSDFQGSL